MNDLSGSLPHLVDVADLDDYEDNARTHSDEQIEQLKAAFRRFGFVGVIGYDAKGLAIGHGRKRAALEMWEAGEEVWGPGKRDILPKGQLPGVDITGLSDEDRRALIIADNKLALNAGWDEEKLARELAALSELEFDMPVMGFDQRELDRLINGEVEKGKSGAGKMAAEFLIPPFSVLNAREGWWQERKRQWLALGIKSEVGRGENLLRMSDTMLEPDPEKRAAMQERRAERERPKGLGGVTMQSLSSHPRYYEQKTAAEQRLGRKLTPEEFERDHWVEPDSEIISGTSIFDPVLCELVYRWWSPKGGQVLDPFAGGSVRGIVAAALGRRYTGIDLRPEQIAANEAQWPAIAAQLATEADTIAEAPPLSVDEIDGIRVVRDDRVLGGTKRRALDLIIGQIEAEELIYATPAYGFAQIALAAACRGAGKKATVVVAGRKVPHIRTQMAAQLGAEIITVEKGGYLTTVQKRAAELAESRGAYLVPFGMEDEIFIDVIAKVASSLEGPAPTEVWCVAGSGVLSRALQRAWPDAEHHAVQIGRDPDVGDAKLWKAPEKFEDPAQDPPPFPSCDNYDAKAWRFIKEHASEGALFWNLGADIEEPTDRPEPRWLVGDSAEVLPALELEADLVFSCPPYGDLEVYSDDPHDISTMDVEAFDKVFAEIVAKAVGRLKPDRFACFVVGDYREKGPGFYRNFVSKTIAAFENAGARLYNEIVLVTSVGSLPIRAAKQFRSTRKVGKTHQNVLVFCKGDPRRATEACGVVDVSAALAEIEPEDEAQPEGEA